MKKTKSASELHSLGFPPRIVGKVLTREEATAKLKGFPRREALVMCHGTFDLVHPGHLRHLAYAKNKGATLIVSITSDEFVTKSNRRPYVPQELRSLNLAALEIVDFVVIDENAEPISLIQAVQPDIFVKGFEYESKDSPKTRAEIKALASYGGEMVYSPGDYVYSSSALIENEPPNLSGVRLATLMSIEGVDFDDLRSCLASFVEQKVTVLGDTIVDSITSSSVIGGFRKTPTPSVRVETSSQFVGGAGIVAKHLSAAGARTNLFTILGRDELADWVQNDLRNSGVELHYLASTNRPTTNKNAIVVGNHPVIRVDTVSNAPISASELSELSTSLSNEETDAVIFADFRHGIFNRDSIPVFLSSAPSSAIKIADSQVASRWGNISDFKDCDLLTPNEEEVRFALADQDTVIRPLGASLYKEARCSVLMLKLGSRGMLVYRAADDLGDKKFFFSIDSLTRQPVIDPVGSGDALLAYATLAYTATKNEVLAAILGTVAAGIACERLGNVPVTHSEVTDRLQQLESELTIG